MAASGRVVGCQQEKNVDVWARHLCERQGDGGGYEARPREAHNRDVIALWMQCYLPLIKSPIISPCFDSLQRGGLMPVSRVGCWESNTILSFVLSVL